MLSLLKLEKCNQASLENQWHVFKFLGKWRQLEIHSSLLLSHLKEPIFMKGSVWIGSFPEAQGSLVFCFVFEFWDRVLPCSPDWCGTCFLPQSPTCWYCRHVWPHLACFFLIFNKAYCHKIPLILVWTISCELWWDKFFRNSWTNVLILLVRKNWSIYLLLIFGGIWVRSQYIVKPKVSQ
jgi:hypothetical protein